MKQLFISIYLLSFSFSAGAYEQVLCTESKQESPFVLAEYFTEDGSLTVILKSIGSDGEVSKVDTLVGSEPDLSITSVTTDEGEMIVIIQSMNIETMEFRTLVCVQGES